MDLQVKYKYNKIELEQFAMFEENDNPEIASIVRLHKDGQIIFAPQLLVQFASFCYGTMRGVIYTKTLGSSLNNYILPPVYFGNLIDKGFAVKD